MDRGGCGGQGLETGQPIDRTHLPHTQCRAMVPSLQVLSNAKLWTHTPDLPGGIYCLLSDDTFGQWLQNLCLTDTWLIISSTVRNNMKLLILVLGAKDVFMESDPSLPSVTPGVLS